MADGLGLTGAAEQHGGCDHPERGDDDRHGERGPVAVRERCQGSGAPDTAAVERIATPTAPPIWKDALFRPEASPASDSGTPVSDAIEPAT